jgi:hypothetical protein
MVQCIEFTSTEDGQHFVKRLEGFPEQVLRKLPTHIEPSQVDSMLVIVQRDGRATVYVNELDQIARIRAAGPVEKGAPVRKNDIVDLDRLELGVEIPDDAGVMLLFSIRWRKGLFYDFCPISGPDPQPRRFDAAAVFGQSYCHVLFQERFSISDQEWSTLFASKWFPFAGLSHETIDGLITHIRAGWDLDEKTDDIVSEVKTRLPQMLAAWQHHSSFATHIAILERAIERFRDEDWLSCTGLLFPRIEGILRTHHTSIGSLQRPSPNNLTDTAVASKIDNEKCLFLPQKFARYLREVYFANFDPAAVDVDVSRHSVAHGVASPSLFDKKSAVIGLLVVHQLFYFLDQKRDDGPVPETSYRR